MAKNIKKLFAMILVVCMLVSALPMQALAADEVTTTETSPEGLTTDVTTTTETSTDEAGNTTVTVTIEKTTEGTTEQGTEVERQETSTTETKTDADGNGVQTTVSEGKETITETTPVENVTVSVPTEAGSENTGSDGEASVSGPSGDVQQGEEDSDFDQTTVTTTPGTVTVTTSDVTITETVETEKTDMEYIKSETTPTADNDLVYKGQAPEEYLPGYEGETVIPESVPGYDYVYVGSGNTSKFFPSIVFDSPLTDEQKVEMYGENAYILSSYYPSYYIKQLKQEDRDRIAYNEDGSYVTDENGFILDVDGNRIFKEERTEVDPDGNTTYLHRFDNYNSTLLAEGWYKDGEWVKEMNGKDGYYAIWAGAQQFILVDSDGNIVTTYCADFSTPTQDSFGYNVENLEDATYYSDEEAKMIRTIAANGYWGTESGFGSLETMRAQLLASGEFTEEELVSLTDGVALTATQMAIWSQSNKMSGLNFVNSFYSNWGAGNVPKVKTESVELMFKLYDYLLALEPTETQGTTTDTIINSDNFIKDMSVTVVKKAEDHANNKDDDNKNDAYVTDLSFALVVEPVEGNGDDMKVTVVTADGRKYVGRIAGALQEGETQLVQENGSYCFKNIVLTEGDQTFTLNLEGIQNLQEGVYLYSSEVKADDSNSETSSQTLVGVASGSRGFNVSMDISFNLDVNEGVVATERVWRSTSHNEITPDPIEPADLPDEDPWTPPQIQRLANDGVEIPEEPVPLAAPAITGDSTGLWIVFFLMIAMGLAAINLFDKKRTV